MSESQTIQVYVIDHQSSPGHKTLTSGVDIAGFKAGNYNGSAVKVLVNSQEEDDDYVIQDGDRLTVAPSNNKGA